MMYSIKQEKDKFIVGQYVPVTWTNPIFGPRTVQEWETLREFSDFDGAVELVAKLNGANDD